MQSVSIPIANEPGRKPSGLWGAFVSQVSVGALGVAPIYARPPRTRPEGLSFDVHEVPPWATRAMLGLQHFFVIAPNITIVLLVARAAGADAETTGAMISFTLIGLAISTLLQTSARTGSGYFIPGCISSIYASASLAAAVAGGLPLVWGMTLLAGLFQMVFSRYIVRLRHLFPNEIVALSVIIVGIELGSIGLARLAGSGQMGLLIGVSTFSISVILGVYGRGAFKLYCALLGIVAGCGLSYCAGLTDSSILEQALAGPIIAVPSLAHVSLAFDSSLVLPFLFAAIAASLKTMGAVVAGEKINDARWLWPNMRQVQKGIFVDGLATVVSGALGSCGTNSSTMSVGVSHATGATSNAIGPFLAAILCLLALSPEFARIFAAMPDAVVGGGLLFAACLVMVSGLNMLGTVAMDMRRAGIIAFPLLLVVARIGNFPIFTLVPEILHPLVSSALSVGVFSAILVNAFFRIGTSKRARIDLPATQRRDEWYAAVKQGLDACGVAQNVKARVLLSLREVLKGPAFRLDLRFDGSTLRTDLTPLAPNGMSERFRERPFFLVRLSDRIEVTRFRQVETLSVYYYQ